MDLAELILRNKGDRSYRSLERDCGGDPTAKRIQQIASGVRPLANFPDPPSIRGLARGLRVTELAVVLAAGESLGLEVDRALPRLAQLLPAGVERLTEQEVNAVLTMVQTMVGARSAEQVTGAGGVAAVASEVQRRLEAERAAADAARHPGAARDSGA